MIRNQKLWEKIKDLKGTDDELRRLNELNAKELITATEYWRIKAKWMENKHKEINKKG